MLKKDDFCKGTVFCYVSVIFAGSYKSLRWMFSPSGPQTILISQVGLHFWNPLSLLAYSFFVVFAPCVLSGLNNAKN